MSRAKGNQAEDVACSYLQEHNFTIVTRNYYSRFGEIDIIATKGGVLHFVEVKSGEDFQHAIQNITPSKVHKIIKTAYAYMKKNGYGGDFCIDGVVVSAEGVEIVENLTI
jgi:putative endonuclease